VPTYTAPGTYTFTVPAGVTAITGIDIRGAEGGTDHSGTITPGKGGRLQVVSLPVLPAETITIVVGAQGYAGATGETTSGGTGTSIAYGHDLNGRGHSGGGGGGAASHLQVAGVDGTRVKYLAAGGGGGAGGRRDSTHAGGAGGDGGSSPVDGGDTFGPNGGNAYNGTSFSNSGGVGSGYGGTFGNGGTGYGSDNSGGWADTGTSGGGGGGGGFIAATARAGGGGAGIASSNPFGGVYGGGGGAGATNGIVLVSDTATGRSDTVGYQTGDGYITFTYVGEFGGGIYVDGAVHF